MITPTDYTLTKIKGHAEQDFPKESCGLVIVKKGKQKYIPCKNIAQGLDFAIDPEDYAAAEDEGEIIMVVHSHPNISPKPSQADLIGCEESQLPWLIVNWPTGVIHQFEPTGYKAPLIGRQYAWGLADCFTLIRDYYKEELNIEIKDVPRDPNFWHRKENLYIDNYAAAGFVIVDDPKKHDVVLMNVRSPIPNHGAIYIGDNIILQHLEGRLSSRDVYGGLYSKTTSHILRHGSLVR